MIQKIQLTGNNNCISLSLDGATNLNTPYKALITGYDGGAKWIDLHYQKIRGKFKVKGSRPEIIVHHQRISSNGRYVAFSCLRKVFVFDTLSELTQSTEELAEKGLPIQGKNTGKFPLLIKVIEISEAERRSTVNFEFHPTAPIIIVPMGKELHFVHLENELIEVLPMPNKEDFSHHFTISPDGKYLAHQTFAENKIEIYDLETQTPINILEIPFQYYPGRQMFENRFQFVPESQKLMVFRKSEGISGYDFRTGEEFLHIPFSEIGYRALFDFRQSIFSQDAKLLLFKAEHSDDKDLNNWSVGTNQREWMLYNVAKKAIIWRHKGSEMHADFIRIDDKSVVVAILQHYRNPENYSLEEILEIHKISI